MGKKRSVCRLRPPFVYVSSRADKHPQRMDSPTAREFELAMAAQVSSSNLGDHARAEVADLLDLQLSPIGLAAMDALDPSDGPLVVEIKYSEPRFPLLTYHLAVDEQRGSPIVVEEWLRWKRGSYGQPFRFLDYKEGRGKAVSGEMPDVQDTRRDIPLQSPDLIAVNALGQFADHPRVAALREFITGWYVSYLSIDNTRGQPEAGPQERLSRSGDNLANVIQYLAEQHPDRLNRIFETLRSRVPRVEKVLAEAMPDGRLLLTIKDAPFDNPILARFASDGTLKMLAYLVLLYDPTPPPFIGIEE